MVIRAERLRGPDARTSLMSLQHGVSRTPGAASSEERNASSEKDVDVDFSELSMNTHTFRGTRASAGRNEHAWMGSDPQTVTQPEDAYDQQRWSGDSETCDAYDQLDDDELSSLAYARRYGLIASHLSEHPFHAVRYAPPDCVQSDLEDPPSTLNIGSLACLGAFNGNNAHEKWDVDKDAASFLASFLAYGKDHSPEEMCSIDGLSCLKDCKLEEPIMSSDPEIDILRLKRRNKVVISSNGMTLCPINEKNGEGLAWSEGERGLAAEAISRASNEKLAVDRETMEYLKDIKMPSILTDEDSVYATLKRSVAQQSGPVTPPLLPLLPSPSPVGFSIPADPIMLTSTPEDLCAVEARATETRIMEVDEGSLMNMSPSELQHTDSGPNDIYSALRTPLNSSSSPLRSKRLRDLKADLPLLPQDQTESPPKKLKSVSFSAELHTLISTPDNHMNMSEMEEDTDTFIAEVVTPFAESAIQRTEDEQLVEIDTTLRVHVPHINDVELTLPWQNDSSTPEWHKPILLPSRTELTSSEASWSGVSKLERLLPWSPFPARLGKVQLDETFDDGSLARYMSEMSVDEHIDIEALVWKPEGLRLCDASESDDEELGTVEYGQTDLAEGQHPLELEAIPSGQLPELPTRTESKVAESRSTRVDMQTLLKQRKFELENGRDSKQKSEESHQLDLRDTQKGNRTRFTMARNDMSNIANVGGLSGFMQRHGAASGTANKTRVRKAPHAPPMVPAAVMIMPAIADTTGQAVPPLSVTVPKINVFAEPTSIIVSSAVSANRQLIRQVQEKLPMLDLVERDILRLSPTRSKQSSKAGNKHEADFTISPGTGLVFITLQKLKQQPLPGQSNFSGVRERIVTTALRYERLIVLISENRQQLEGKPPAISELDAIDAEAISDLISSTAQLDTEVEVCYIPGGEPELAQWIAVSISTYATVSAHYSLLHDETMWERLLRHAGLSPYAAQVIFSQLKQPETAVEVGSSSSMTDSTVLHGLAAFVQMPREERMQRFAPLMGGDRVLRRVNEVIDGGWLSAATMR